MHTNQIGTVEIISFRTTHKDDAYKYPFNGVLTGTSISHIALRLTFTGRDLFEKYIENNRNIAYNDELVEKNTGVKLYEVYFSFWPSTQNVALLSEPSKLYNHQHDCEISALGTPMTYSTKYARYLHPQREQISSMIPLLNYLIRDTISLPPTLMFHTTRFKNTLDTLYAQTPDAERQSIVDSIITKSKEFALKYKTWFTANVEQESYAKSIFADSNESKKLSLKEQQSQRELLICKEEFKQQIKSAIFPNSELSDNEFGEALEQFYTFGMPEIDTITLPLIGKSSDHNCQGLKLEPMLQYIANIANNPNQFQYNLINQNCATVLRDILLQGIKSCFNNQLKQAFNLPWYARWFGLPVSPAMVMYLASKMAEHPSILRVDPICVQSNQFIYIQESKNILDLKHRVNSEYIENSSNVEILSAYRAQQTDDITSEAKVNRSSLGLI